MRNDEVIYIATSNYYFLFPITIIIFIIIIGIIIIIYVIIIIIIIITIMSFYSFHKGMVFNAKIFLLGELQLVTKDQEDAFTLHV